MLRMAGRVADIVSLNFDNRSGKLGGDGVHRSTAEATSRKVEWVREGAGDRWGDVELEVGAYFTDVTSSSSSVVGELAARFDLPASDVRSHPHVLVGSVEALCEELVRRRDRLGISFVTIPVASLHAFAPIVARLAGR